MKKKVMKQVIKRQREQIENLTKALAAMSTLNKRSNSIDIPVRTIPYVNGTRLDPRLSTRVTSPGLAESIKEADQENQKLTKKPRISDALKDQQFTVIPDGVDADISLYPNGMKTFSFRGVDMKSKHDDVLDGAARMYAETKAERKAAILKDIDKSEVKEEASGIMKSICPDMKSPRSGGERMIDARIQLDDDDYVYRLDWQELLHKATNAELPVLGVEWYGDLATKCQSMSDISALVLARAVIDKSSMLRATIWLIEAIRFLNEQCSEGKRYYGDVNNEPVHGMLVAAFRTASKDIRNIIVEAILDEYNESRETSKEEN